MPVAIMVLFQQTPVGTIAELFQEMFFFFFFQEGRDK